MSEDEDPFEEFEASVGDREGDPFAGLDDGEDPADASQDRDPDTPEAGEDPSALADSGEGTASEGPPGEPVDPYDGHDVTPAGHGREMDATEQGSTAGADAGTSPGETSVSDASADTFVAPEDREGDPFEDAESAFERMDVEELDPDEVWESLSDAQQRGSVAEMEDRRYAEVSKHSFCEQCEFFSPPPEVRCNHEGTEILEFVDIESVRVVDCPVVAERKRLQQE